MPSATATDAQWAALLKLVNSFAARADAEPFRVAVDWKALGLYDYPQLIKKQMDLGTVKQKLTSKKYKTLLEAVDDVRLVWTNCMTYNQDGSDFYTLAKNLSKRWEDRLQKVAADHSMDLMGSGADHSHGKVSIDDKRTFARSLYKISKEDMGKIIVQIDSKCPQALTKNSAEDEAELNVDKISPALFQELVTFVASCQKQKGGNNAGTMASSASMMAPAAAAGGNKKKKARTGVK